MPARRLPNSMPAVIRTLKTARDKYVNTPNAADRAISAEQFAQLDEHSPSLLNSLLKEASDVDTAQALQSPLCTDLAQKAERLTTFVSHFHQTLDLGIAHGYFAGGARSYYGRDVGATSIPDLSTYDAVQDAAEKIINGEAARQSAEGANYKQMVMPSAAEIMGQLMPFKAGRAAAQQAQETTDTQSEELMALYPEAHDLAVDICDTVEFFYRKDPDDGSRRTKCQRWGVVYVYDDGTPVPAPATTPAPAATTTTPAATTTPATPATPTPKP